MPLAVVRALPHALLTGLLATLLFAGREWAYVTTYRLNLDARIDDGRTSTATQRFDLENDRVVPKLLTRDDRVLFRAAVGRDSTIRTAVQPDNGATYTVVVQQNGAPHVLAAGRMPASLVLPLATGNGIVELRSTGRVTWSDLRLQRDFPTVRLLSTLACLLCGLLLCLWRGPWGKPASARSPSSGLVAVWLRVYVLVGSSVLAGFVAEAALRAVGSRLSAGIRTARHDLGERTDDPRWEDSLRFGHRLRANLHTTNEWRHGDIIRMGFIPADAGDGRLHRYPFDTDAEGFRNAAVRDPIDIAALGDSFTDAQTIPAEAAWPAQLERRSGLRVQNYGTAGFGPQQELRVLEAYVIGHRPRLVVLAFFAGNDIYEAEALDGAGRIDGMIGQPPRLGWPIKTIVARTDTWYLVNAVQAASAAALRSATSLEARTLASMPAEPSAATSRFHHGLITVSVNGRTVRVALMPPYLNTLNFSESDIASRRGWRLTRETLVRMRDVSYRAGAGFVLMFLPSKSQVVLPVLERTMLRPELIQAFEFYLRDFGGHPDVDRLARNRLALNALMSRFCQEEGIPMLDLTPALQAGVEAGEEMFFPDDSHLNERGESLVAETLLGFLQARGLSFQSH